MIKTKNININFLYNHCKIDLAVKSIINIKNSIIIK